MVTGGEGTPIDRGLQGTVLHLNDYIKATGLDMGDVWEGLLEPVVWRDGRVFGMPYGPDMRVLYMNIDLYVSGGLDPATGPQTWDDFEEAIQKTTQKDAAGNLTVAGFPPDWGSNGTWLFMLPLLQLGGSRTNDDRTKMTFNTPEGVEAFTFVKRLWDLQDGYTAVKAFQESALPSGRGRGAALVNAKCASIYMTYAERKQQIIPLEPDYEFGYTGFPLARQSCASGEPRRCLDSHGFRLDRGGGRVLCMAGIPCAAGEYAGVHQDLRPCAGEKIGNTVRRISRERSVCPPYVGEHAVSYVDPRLWCARFRSDAH